jgi:hypothetical protein
MERIQLLAPFEAFGDEADEPFAVKKKPYDKGHCELPQHETGTGIRICMGVYREQ